MERRTFLMVATAAAVGAMTGPYVHAQSKKFAGITLRVNGFGGLYDETLQTCVAAPLQEKYGLKVQFTAGTQAADLVKLIANRDNPPYDLFQGDSAYMVELLKADLIEEISASDVPNIKRILPGFREYGDFGVPYSVFTNVLVYNSKYIKQALTSYSDIARPDLKDRAIVPAAALDTVNLYLLGLAEENGGSISNMEPAFKVLEVAKPNIVALSQSPVAGVQIFENEEAYAGITTDGRAHELRAKGFPIVTVIPPKGLYAVTTYMNVVKGSKYPEAARAVAEQVLSDEGMIGLPQALGIGVTTDIKLPEEIQRDLVFNSAEHNALKRQVDWRRWMADRSVRIERINKVIRG
jgi:spermidine/putrescine-binding protein